MIQKKRVSETQQKDYNVLQIQIVHPMVQGAEDFLYQVWPVDETDTWNMHFETVKYQQRLWKVRGWDRWRVLIMSTIDSLVESGFWNQSEVFGVLNWKKFSARTKEGKDSQKKMDKLSKKVQMTEDSKLQENEKEKKLKKKKKKKVKKKEESEEFTAKKKKKKKKKRKRKESCNGKTEISGESKAKGKKGARKEKEVKKEAKP